jgi:hypothetical protein
MSDVRLTATNPVDSTVVPVACNEKGELLTVPPVIEQIDNDVTINGDLTLKNGNSLYVLGPVGIGNADPAAFGGLLAVWGGAVVTSHAIVSRVNNSLPLEERGFRQQIDGQERLSLYADNTNGAALNVNEEEAMRFSRFGDIGIGTDNPQSKLDVNGDVIVGSRNKSWMLVEQGGLCHMVEQTRTAWSDDEDLVEPTPREEVQYPKLRDVFNELDLVEQALNTVMEKLRLNPPAGWPVWDGSNETA